jgi:hypothetical protein
MPHIPLEVLSRGWLNIMRFITGSDSVSDNQLVRFDFDASQLFAQQKIIRRQTASKLSPSAMNQK